MMYAFLDIHFSGLPCLPPSQPSILFTVITDTVLLFLQLNCLDRFMVISQDDRVMVLRYSSDFVIPVIRTSSLFCDKPALFILKIISLIPANFSDFIFYFFSHLPPALNHMWFLKYVLLMHVCLLFFLIHQVNTLSALQPEVLALPRQSQVVPPLSLVYSSVEIPVDYFLSFRNLVSFASL